MGFWRFRTLQDGDDRSFATGELEYEREPLHDGTDLSITHDDNESLHKPNDFKLMLSFVALIISGTANTVFNKLQTIPMYNYPNFINFFGNLLFIPITFAYILPAYWYGWFNQSITRTQWTMSLRPFAIMGALDCVAGMMQTFSAVYLPGPLLVLLPQAAIPISMIFSRHILGARYRALQYIGAIVVLMGIVVVLEPEISHRNTANFICEANDMEANCSLCQAEITRQACLAHRLDHDPLLHLEKFIINQDNQEGTPVCEWIATTDSANGEQSLVLIWSCVMIFSCFPMALSTIYKELVLDDHMDPVFLNGWIVVFQTIYSAILAVPAGMASTPAVQPQDTPQNLLDGIKCFFNINSIHKGCHPDDCSTAALYFCLGLLVNVLYILTSMFVVKWGSTSLFFLGLTIMVPLGNLVFAILPSKARSSFHLSDILGLLVILFGLFMYRFSNTSSPIGILEHLSSPQDAHNNNEFHQDHGVAHSSSLKEPLLQAAFLEDQLHNDDPLGQPSCSLHNRVGVIHVDQEHHEANSEPCSVVPQSVRTADL